MSDSIFDTLCGESGVVDQITNAQNQIRQVVTGGKNAINSVRDFVSDVETLSDAIKNSPGVVERRLQEDIKNLLTREALANPTGTLAKLLEIRAAYQNAGPAAQRAIENVEQFIKDPLNTPLTLCEDIPNVVKLGETVAELGAPAKTTDTPPTPPSKDSLDKTLGKAIQTVPRFPTQTLKNAVEAAGRYSGSLGPGAANEAAINQ